MLASLQVAHVLANALTHLDVGDGHLAISDTPPLKRSNHDAGSSTPRASASIS
jgi:hypothetical protein